MKFFKISMLAALLMLAASPAMAQDKLKTTAAQSTIQAVGAKVTGDHTLTFKKFEGSATLKKGKIATISFTVQAAEFTTEMGDSEWGKKLVGHLQSPDFFDVAKHPTAVFESTAIVEKASKWGTHEVTGKLTLRGKTQTIRFPATIKLDKAQLTGKTEFTINRKDFGLSYPGKPDDLIKDAVLLKVSLNFKR